MNFKKAVSFSLVVLTAVLSLSGCRSLQSNSSSSSSDSGNLVPEKGATIKYKTDDQSDSDFANAVAAQFKAKYAKYGVNVIVQQGGLDDALKLKTDIPSGNGPDVATCADDKTYEYVKANLFRPLDQSIVKELKSNIRPLAMSTVTYNGKVYGAPLSLETYVLFYNKKLVDQVAGGKPVTSYEELAAQAKVFNDPTQNKYWFLFDASTGSPQYPMISAYGFNLFGKSGTDEDPGLKSAAFEKGLEVLKAYHDILPVDAADLGNTDSLDTQFETGKAGYIMDGPWNVKTYKKSGVDLGVVPVPSYKGHQGKTFAFVHNVQVSAFSKYPKASELFVEFLTSRESASLLYQKSNRITARNDYSSISGLKDDKVLIPIAKAFNNAVMMPRNTKISYYWSVMRDVGQNVYNGKLTPQAGQQKALQDWDDFCKSAG